MTSTSYVSSEDFVPPRRDWGKAARHLFNVVRDTSQSGEVANMVTSIEGPSLEACFQRFRNDPGGRRILEQRPSLLNTLKDRSRLEALPADTLGNRYARYMREERLDADALVSAMSNAGFDEERAFFRDRIRDSHDLWHAITGYGADQLGEGVLLMFSHAQIRSPGIVLLAGLSMALVPLVLPNDRAAYPEHALRAWIRGYRAKWLPAQPLEEMLDWPIEDVWRELNIMPTEEAHPGGFPQFNMGDRRMRRTYCAF